MLEREEMHVFIWLLLSCCFHTAMMVSYWRLPPDLRADWSSADPTLGPTAWRPGVPSHRQECKRPMDPKSQREKLQVLLFRVLVLTGPTTITAMGLPPGRSCTSEIHLIPSRIATP